MKDDLSQEIHGGRVLSPYVQALKTWCCAPPPKKKNQRPPSLAKVHLKMIDTLG